jgi:hypothetical protein
MAERQTTAAMAGKEQNLFKLQRCGGIIRLRNVRLPQAGRLRERRDFNSN